MWQSDTERFDSFEVQDQLNFYGLLDWQVKLSELLPNFAAGGMGVNGQVARSNPEPLMSALGQKQTPRLEISMSALPPKADIDG